MPVDDRILRGPNLQYPGQHLGFRPPEEPQSPPPWWTGDRVGDISGGGLSDPNMIHQFWRDLADHDDQYIVQICCEDRIHGTKVFRTSPRLECRIKADSLSPAGARKLADALRLAADLLDKG